MAKPKKRKRSNRKGSQPNRSPEVLAIEGDKYLETGNFIRAVEVFKQLLKAEPCRQWQEKLAKAYLGRAQGLLAKGMAKEALAILDNVAHFCPEITPDESLLLLNISLLIAAGRSEKAVDLYRCKARQLTESKAGKGLDELFAALCLASEGGILSSLAEESALVAHYPCARDALRAYCRQEDAEARQQLKQIPFRSPYRNFSLALKGLLLLPSDVTGAARAFTKIPQSSPFYPLIATTVASLQADLPLVNWGGLNRSALQLQACLRGVAENKLAVLVDLFRAQNQPQKQFALLCRQGKEVDAAWAQRACLSLLPIYPGGGKTYAKTFEKLSEEETYRLQALSLEHDDDWSLALRCWQMYINLLVAAPKTAERELSLALVYRHMAEILRRKFGNAEDEYADSLGKSIAHDPTDKATYQQLFDSCQNDKKALRTWIELALQHFPADIDILLAAAEFALKANAFKKTARYAEKILRLDPINTRVRELLLQAHLAHGRKLAKAGKFELACKEYLLAETQQRTELHQGMALICQGLLKLLVKEEQPGQALIQMGQQRIALPCQAWLITAVEAALMGLPPGQRNEINRQLKACNQTDLSKVEFFRLLEQIKTYQNQDPEVMKKLDGPLRPLLKKSADLGFSPEESRTLCDGFYRDLRFDLLQPFAKAAESHCPEIKIFTFYRLYAKVTGFSDDLIKKDRRLLETIKGEAAEQDDFHLYDLIDEFLDFQPMRSFFNGGDPADFNPRLIESILDDLDEEDWDDPFPFKIPKAKKAKKKTTKGPIDPFEQLELF